MVLAERYSTRNELGRRIAQDDLYIMLLTFPLSGLLIWIIIGRGLDSLDRVAKKWLIASPIHLEPVNLDEVPEEIKPLLTNSINYSSDYKRDLNEKKDSLQMRLMNYEHLLLPLKLRLR